MATPTGSLIDYADYLQNLLRGGDDAVGRNLKKKILDSLKAGKISPEIKEFLAKYAPNDQYTDNFETQFNRILGDSQFLFNPTKYLQDELGKVSGDYSTLTDDELNRKLELYDAISKETRGQFDYGIDGAVIDYIGQDRPADFNLKLGYQQASPLTNTEEVKSIRDILSGRRELREKNATIDKFIQDLPGQLTASREDYLSGLEDRQIQKFENEYIPSAYQNLNVRGVLDSGEAIDAFGVGLGNVQSTVDQARIELEQSDNDFFFDMAYQDQLRKSLDAAKDYQSAIGQERTLTRNSQEQRFQEKESQINRDFNFGLQDISYKNQLNAQEIRAKRQRDAQEDKKRSQLYGQAGAAGGAIIGASVAGPAGAAVGSQIGGGAGYLD